MPARFAPTTSVNSWSPSIAVVLGSGWPKASRARRNAGLGGETRHPIVATVGEDYHRQAGGSQGGQPLQGSAGRNLAVRGYQGVVEVDK